MSILIPGNIATAEKISFPHFITLCGIPQVAIDCIWESNMLAEWSESDPIPAAPTLQLATLLAARQSSLRALGVAVTDPSWLEEFVKTTITPGLEGAALNPLLPATALATLATRAPELVDVRLAAGAALAAHRVSPTDHAGVAAALIEARMGTEIRDELAAAGPLADALREALVLATGGPSSQNARLVRAALVGTGSHDDLLVAVSCNERGVIDTPLVARLAALVESGVIPAEAIKARAHADAVEMTRRCGLEVLAPRRRRDAITKEAEDVLAQFSVFVTIDPTPAARRAIRWWSSLEKQDVDRILDAADVETVVDWCQGAMQVAPDADEIVALLSRMDAKRFDEFCAEVTRRPDPTEEHPALSIALKEPMRQEWRPAGVHLAAGHLVANLTEDNHWHTAVALLANGWKSTMWELAACAQQV